LYYTQLRVKFGLVRSPQRDKTVGCTSLSIL